MSDRRTLSYEEYNSILRDIVCVCVILLNTYQLDPAYIAITLRARVSLRQSVRLPRCNMWALTRKGRMTAYGRDRMKSKARHVSTRDREARY